MKYTTSTRIPREEVIDMVDVTDHDIVNKYSWVLQNGYVVSSESIPLHRYIIKTSLEVDHIDGNKLNNHRYNLREVTRSQNSMNKNKYKSNKTGYKGVFVNKAGGFRVQIATNGKQIHVGVYQSKELAALAYNKAAIKYHGEFARLNEV